MRGWRPWGCARTLHLREDEDARSKREPTYAESRYMAPDLAEDSSDPDAEDSAAGSVRLLPIQTPRPCNTSRNTSGRSVTSPSTPKSSNAPISTASSTVHTCTSSPHR